MRHEWAFRARRDMDALMLETASWNVVHELARTRSRGNLKESGKKMVAKR